MAYRLILIGTLFNVFHAALSGQLPADFGDELVIDHWNASIGIEFIDSNLWYVWQRNGQVKIVENEKVLDILLLDIRAEVGNWGDHGLLSMTVHPKFKENGYIFLAYIVDGHYLRYYGTNDYDPAQSDKAGATIGRVTRYQVNTDDFKSIVPNSRYVLLGKDIGTGIPVLAPAHGVGGIDFGTDGSLLIGTGDGTTWVGDHTGGENYKEFGYDSIGKIEGFIRPEEDVGSYRAQMLSSLNGKILRLDPISGKALPSNPFYDENFPNNVQSKVYALGIRSPYRLRVRPDSGSKDMLAGDPGKIYFGDVGSNQFEELNIVQVPGQNFGWPSYEGVGKNQNYFVQEKQNSQAPNPLSGSNDCQIEFFRFNDLIIPEQRDHKLFWQNPCNPFIAIPEGLQKYVHTPPVLTWGNRINNPGITFSSGFDAEGKTIPVKINDTNAPVLGHSFDGISSIGGDFTYGNFLPEAFQNVYFLADYSGWIKAVQYDVHGIDEIHKIINFSNEERPVVHLEFNRFDGCLYYFVLDYRSNPFVQQLRRICYSGNPKPVAIIEANHHFGKTPLAVHFSGNKSYDPKGDRIQYRWQFGANLQSNSIDTTIIFMTPDGKPVNEAIELTVTDPEGKSDRDEMVISLNNTPPTVEITSIEDGEKYTLQRDKIEYDLIAQVFDQEQADDQLSYTWRIKLNHNEHTHLEFTDTNRTSSVVLFALDNTEYDKHAYTISLTVSDALGLVGYDEVTIYPDVHSFGLDSEINHKFWVFPNPTKDYLYLRVQEGDQLIHRYTIQLVNTLGQLIGSWDVNDFVNETLMEMSFEAVGSGIYCIYILDNNQIVHQQKIIKL